MKKEYCEKKIAKLTQELTEAKKDMEHICQITKDNMTNESQYYASFLRSMEAHDYSLASVHMSVSCSLSKDDPVFNEKNKEILDNFTTIKRKIDMWKYQLIDSAPVRFDGDIIITDPCYIRDHESDNDFDWLEWAENNGICRDTIYGDWSCTTYNKDSKEELGHFCADSGTVCVVSLEKVLKANPMFNYHSTHPWTTTLIKDFHGEVGFEVKETHSEWEEEDYIDYEVQVVGRGNINFFTTQTGF